MPDNMKGWIGKYFSDTWKEIETDIDFSKYEPISTKELFIGENIRKHIQIPGII